MRLKNWIRITSEMNPGHNNNKKSSAISDTASGKKIPLPLIPGC
jgi:hypothetical protein